MKTIETQDELQSLTELNSEWAFYESYADD